MAITNDSEFKSALAQLSAQQQRYLAALFVAHTCATITDGGSTENREA